MVELKKLPLPTEPWVDRLRPRHWIWLSKEQRFVQVAVPWRPPEPGTYTGQIGIYYHGGGHVQLWCMHRDGKGFDGKQLIEPVEDNLPDDPPELPPAQVQQILYAQSLLIERVMRLEQRISHLESLDLNLDDWDTPQVPKGT